MLGGPHVTLVPEDAAPHADCIHDSSFCVVPLAWSPSTSKPDNCHKGFNGADRYFELIRLVHDEGITLMSTFVFGLEEDLPNIFMKTARSAVEAYPSH